MDCKRFVEYHILYIVKLIGNIYFVFCRKYQLFDESWGSQIISFYRIKIYKTILMKGHHKSYKSWFHTLFSSNWLHQIDCHESHACTLAFIRISTRLSIQIEYLRENVFFSINRITCHYYLLKFSFMTFYYLMTVQRILFTFLIRVKFRLRRKKRCQKSLNPSL